MRSVLLVALFVWSSAQAARAQALVQLGFSGEIDRSGGGRIELELAFQSDAQPRVVSLGLYLAEHTSAADLASLFSRRLTGAGARVSFTGEQASQRGYSNVFVEDVISVALRSGSGVHVSVTVCEEAPALMRIRPPREQAKGAAYLTITAGTLRPHDQTRGKVEIKQSISAGQETSSIAQDLVTASIGQGWIAERANHEAWRPGALVDGSVVTGCSIELHSNSTDWRLELEIKPKLLER